MEERRGGPAAVFKAQGEPLCKANAPSMIDWGLYWHGAPGQSQVLGEENWQSGFGLTWLNDTVTSPHPNHPHLKGK